MHDHLLLIGFGSPEKAEDVGEFLRGIGRRRQIPEERLKEVRSHYKAIGGVSPYTREVLDFCERLRELISIPVFIGMRYWHPYLKDTLVEIHSQGLTRGMAMILAPHRSQAGDAGYISGIRKAQELLGSKIDYTYAPDWHTHPIFVSAQVNRIQEVLGKSPEDGEKSFLLFSAHSLPEKLQGSHDYRQRYRESCDAIVRKGRFKHWACGFQSRSGTPSEAWLGPDVASFLPQIREKGFKRLITIPVGFIFENAEILYNLDIELKGKAQAQGLEYSRIPAIAGDDAFVRLFNQWGNQWGQVP